jgi:hypothetical protein
MQEEQGKMIVGALEQGDLPELRIFSLNMRVDTGAKTSSLHVDNIQPEEIEGVKWVSFDIHPDIHDVARVVRRSSKLKQIRTIKSSNGEREQRYVIDTQLCMGNQTWSIEVTLTDRSGMTYLMLLGREAMTGRLLVDPDKEYLLGENEQASQLNKE